MKIGILTFSKSSSYGATLQTYALCEELKSMGYSPYLIQNALPIESGWKYRIRSWISLGAFARFRKKFLPAFISSSFPVDAVIVGSDQVWNPALTKYKALSFWGKGFGDRVPFIAYAASFGSKTWDFTDLNNEIRGLLNEKFIAVGVREDSGVGICNDNFCIKATVVCDPTILHRDFNKFVALHSKKCFTSFKLANPEDKIWNKLLEEVSIRTGIPHLTLSGTTQKKFYVKRSIQSWLSEIVSSNFLLTDSYHGMIMAILYHKPFVVFHPFSNREERIISLLKKVGLQEHYIKEINSDTIERVVELTGRDIDWEFIDKLLENERKKSLLFLSESLKNI